MMKLLLLSYLAGLVAATSTSTASSSTTASTTRRWNVSQARAYESSVYVFNSQLRHEPEYTSILSLMSAATGEQGSAVSSYLYPSFTRGDLREQFSIRTALITKLPTEAQSYIFSIFSVESSIWNAILDGTTGTTKTTSSMGSASSSRTLASSTSISTSSLASLQSTTAPISASTAVVVLGTTTTSASASLRSSASVSTSTGGVGRGEAGYVVFAGVVGIAAVLL